MKPTAREIVEAAVRIGAHDMRDALVALLDAGENLRHHNCEICERNYDAALARVEKAGKGER